MKVVIIGLQHDLDYVKFVDFNDLMWMDDDGGAPATSNIPPTINGIYRWDMQQPQMQMHRIVVAAQEQETRDHQKDQSIFGNFSDLLWTVVQSATQTSPVETLTATPTGPDTTALAEKTLRTDAQAYATSQSIDTPTDRKSAQTVSFFTVTPRE